MLCSHSERDEPLKRYAERGSTATLTRSHRCFTFGCLLCAEPLRAQASRGPRSRDNSPLVFRLNLSTHDGSRETPATCPKTALSRCHPIPLPDRYSVTSACCKSSASTSANDAALARSGSRKSGTSSAS